MKARTTTPRNGTGARNAGPRDGAPQGPQSGAQAGIGFGELIGAADQAIKFALATGASQQKALADMWFRVGSEWLRFASHRCTAQAELLSSLRHCPDMETFVRNEARFIEDAADEYGQEMERLARAAAPQAGESGAEAREAAKTRKA